MPITSAARRASLESSRVQHPRAPVRYDRGLLDRAMWTPVTSCPASAARAAATAESTPPDMAASTRRVMVLRAYAAWPGTPNSFTRTIGAAMGIFRRPREASPVTPPAISEFWAWWAQARPTIEASLAAGPDQPEPETPGEGLSAEAIEELSRRVHKIHPGLQWEIGGAEDRAPSLTVTGGGDPELRGLTERWARSAPSGSAAGGWSFHPARQPDPEMLTQNLVLGDHEFDLEYVRLGMRADTDRARVHVTVYHP